MPVAELVRVRASVAVGPNSHKFGYETLVLGAGETWNELARLCHIKFWILGDVFDSAHGNIAPRGGLCVSSQSTTGFLRH